MYVLVAFGNHFGIAPGDVVHHSADRLSVARNLAGGKHHHVARCRASRGDGHQSRCAGARPAAPLASRCRCRPRPGRETLRTSLSRDHPAGTRRYPSRWRSPSCRWRRVRRTPPADRTGRQIDHGSACDRCSREHRDDDLALGTGENLFEPFGDIDFRSGESSAIDVRAVGQEREHPFRAQLGKPVNVDGSPSIGV